MERYNTRTGMIPTSTVPTPRQRPSTPSCATTSRTVAEMLLAPCAPATWIRVFTSDTGYSDAETHEKSPVPYPKNLTLSRLAQSTSATAIAPRAGAGGGSRRTAWKARAKAPCGVRPRHHQVLHPRLRTVRHPQLCRAVSGGEGEATGYL